MLKISILGGGQSLIRTLQEKPSALVAVLSVKLNALLFRLQSYIVAEKLSGQMLTRRTGTLAGSVRVVPAAIQGPMIVGVIEAGGGPAFYGKFFETEGVGGTGGTRAHLIMATKARALSFISGGEQFFRQSVNHPGFAVKPFMSSALLESADDIEAALQAALDEELEK